jgi:hypothetical protein
MYLPMKTSVSILCNSIFMPRLMPRLRINENCLCWLRF